MLPLQKRMKPTKRAACMVMKWSQMARVFMSNPFWFRLRSMLPRCPATRSALRPVATAYINSAVILKSLFSSEMAVRV